MRKSLLFIAMFAITLTGFSQLASNPKFIKTNANTNKSINAPVATLTYSSETIGANIGYGGPQVLTAVAQFPATTMATHNGNLINKIVIGVNPANFTGDVVVKIWTDTSNFGATPVASETIAVSALVDGWNEITLSTPYTIDGSQIWVGYTCNSSDYGMYMDDQAHQADGYGDLVCDGTSWANTNVYGASFDHNFQIKAIVDDGASFIDAGITNLTVPNANCDLSASEQLTATVKNNGSADITAAFDLGYTLNSGAEVTVPVTGPIAPGASVDVNFTVDMSADGIFDIIAYTKLPSDADDSNDTAHVATMNTIPNTIAMTVAFDVATMDFVGWNNEDVNADGSTWGVLNMSTIGGAHVGDNGIVYQYNSTNAGDDYMYSNCIDLATGDYTLTYWVNTGGFDEALKVMIGQGQNVAAMTTQIIDMGVINNQTWEQVSANFTITTAGVYNLGFYAYSAADQYWLAVDDIYLGVNTNVNTISTSEINIYPNPTTGLLNVTNAENATINVYNTVGELVKTVSNTNTVDLSDVQNGTYIVKVITNNNIVVKNIVLAK